MVISLFKINLENYLFLSKSSFLIHYLIGYQHNVQYLSSLNKSSLYDIDSFIKKTS